jgi:3-deoxy-D-manno-octulosonate 8-phosphate phosphatase (KDO 8-P phosphatase)
MEYREKLKKIKAFAFDVDGVYSSFMITLPGGEMLRTMDSKDGLITRLAVNAGYKIAVITLGNSESVRARFKRLGITDDYYDSTVVGTATKLTALEMFATKHGLSFDEIMYGGDDLPDIECLKKAGIGVCPADAVEEVRAVADYVSTRKGGQAFVREVIESVLKIQNVKYF